MKEAKASNDKYVKELQSGHEELLVALGTEKDKIISDLKTSLKVL